MSVSPQPNRIRRFVDLYGWRAYAVPLLAVATLLTLVDVASHESAADPSAAGRSSTASSSPADPVTGSASASEVTTTPPPATGGEPGQTSVSSTDAAEAPEVMQRGEGTLRVVVGASDVVGSGPLLRLRVEVENGIDLDAQAFAAAVVTTLGDPRSWGAGGRQSFQRVGPGEAFDFSVALVSPDNVNSFCPGLDTGGYTSCRSGDRAVINLARWLTGVPDYEGDLPTYRQYVVNHEVGHYLGNGHELCPGPGQLAPVMQQQTLALEGCRKNPWPYP